MPPLTEERLLTIALDALEEAAAAAHDGPTDNLIGRNRRLRG